MKLKYNGFLVLLLVLVAQITFAQERVVSGVVSDNTGMPLPGVSVLVKGTKTAAQTDFDGKFSIKATSSQILIFSFIGMKTQEVPASSAKINIKMQDDSQQLQEVVVAYGTQSKASLTGSTSVISGKQIENLTFSNAVQGLEGLAAGLRIVQGSGQPGADPVIRIRGFASINGDSAPLIVLDGVPYTGSLSSINPQDIESTSVLKDASSTSLYGNKASSGVLLITTKKGSKSKTQISVDSRIGTTQRATKEYNIIKTTGEFYESYHSVLANSEFYKRTAAGTPITMQQARQFASTNLIPKLGYNLYDVPNASLVDPNTGRLNSAANLLVNDRWEDALFSDNASFNSTDLNISGGSEDISYYFSLGNQNDNGYTVGSNFKRNTGRLKLSSSKIAKILTLSGDVSYAKSNGQFVPSDGDPNFANAFFWTRRIAPIFPVYKYDQNWKPIPDANNPGGTAYDFGRTQLFPDGTSRGPRQYATGEHPLAVIENSIDTFDRDQYNSALRAKFALPFDIKFEYVVNLLTEVNKTTDFTKPGAGAFAEQNNGLLENGRDDFSALTNQQLLTWKKSFGRHSYDVLLGHETYQEKFTTLSLSKRNIIGNFSPVLNNTSVYVSADNYNRSYITEGYFSRFVYGLDNNYFINLTARRDASSVFHPDERWGNFWSAGASWIISNEKFLKDSKVITFAKFKANYGTTGNDRLFYYDPTLAVDQTGARNYVMYENQYEIKESNGELTQRLFSLGNRNLKWEDAASFDIGLEIGLFNRVNVSVGYYKKDASNLLFNNPIQLSTGQDTTPRNFGDMINSGIETEITWNAIKNDKINIDFNANFSTFNNELTKLETDIQVGNFRREVGRSIYDYYMVKNAGVNPINGNAQWYAKDANGQTIITETYSDAVNTGREFLNKRAIPNSTGGFGTNIEIGGFSLAVQFAYQMGGYGIDNEYFALLSATGQVTNFPDYNKTWTVDNPTASLPRMDPLSPLQYSLSDLYLVDLSYLSLSNINLSYVFKRDFMKKAHIDSIKLYSTVNNAFLLYSARQGYDPRFSSIGASSPEFGANRTISFGAKINLN